MNQVNVPVLEKYSASELMRGHVYWYLLLVDTNVKVKSWTVMQYMEG